MKNATSELWWQPVDVDVCTTPITMRIYYMCWRVNDSFVAATTTLDQNKFERLKELNGKSENRWRWMVSFVMCAMAPSFRSPRAFIIVTIVGTESLFCKRLKTTRMESIRSMKRFKCDHIASNNRRRVKKVSSVHNRFSTSHSISISIDFSHWIDDVRDIQLHLIRFGQRIGLFGMQRRADHYDIANVFGLSACARNCILRKTRDEIAQNAIQIQIEVGRFISLDFRSVICFKFSFLILQRRSHHLQFANEETTGFIGEFRITFGQIGLSFVAASSQTGHD